MYPLLGTRAGGCGADAFHERGRRDGASVHPDCRAGWVRTGDAEAAGPSLVASLAHLGSHSFGVEPLVRAVASHSLDRRGRHVAADAASGVGTLRSHDCVASDHSTCQKPSSIGRSGTVKLQRCGRRPGGVRDRAATTSYVRSTRRIDRMCGQTRPFAAPLNVHGPRQHHCYDVNKS